MGSRLVFVLDWNRARKRLAGLLPAGDVEAVLRWAADEKVGHIAFLLLGADRFVYDAVELSAKVPARYGEPLVEVLGRDAVLDIVRFALRLAAEGLLAGKSVLLIRDELRVEVLRHVQAAQRRLLDASARHAGLVVECAQALQGVVVRQGTSEAGPFLGRALARAARLEHEADEVLGDQRRQGRRVEGAATVTGLTSTADNAVDGLEEAVFLLSLLPEGTAEVVGRTLGPLAGLAVAAAREHLRAVELARQVVARSAPEDLEDFLVAVDRVATLEHEADVAVRGARARFVGEAPDFRTLHVADACSRSTEEAIDALLRSALGLRDLLLGELAVR